MRRTGLWSEFLERVPGFPGGSRGRMVGERGLVVVTLAPNDVSFGTSIAWGDDDPVLAIHGVDFLRDSFDRLPFGAVAFAGKRRRFAQPPGRAALSGRQ